MNDQTPSGPKVRLIAAYAVIAGNLAIYVLQRYFLFVPPHEGLRIEMHSRLCAGIAFSALALNFWGWESFRKSREEAAGPKQPILLQAIGTAATIYSGYYIASIWHLDGLMAAR